MAHAGRWIADGFAARIGAVAWDGLWCRVFEAANGLAPLLLGFSTFGAVGVDASLCKVVGSTAGGDEDTPAVAGWGISGGGEGRLERRSCSGNVPN